MSPRLAKLLQVTLLSLCSVTLVLVSLTDLKGDLTPGRQKLNAVVSASNPRRRFSRSLDSLKTAEESSNTWQTSRTTTRKAVSLIGLDDVYFGVKTSKKFHESRLGVVLDTWAGIAHKQTYFFSDDDDDVLSRRSGNRLVNTNCSAGHTRRDLCCKMGVELDYFLRSDKKWFCHVDDDVYVNVNRLVETLRTYDVTDDWYLGKPSLTNPMTMSDAGQERPDQFWFATGGAGFCISRPLAVKMSPLTRDGKLIGICDTIRLPDDCSIGYIINHLLKVDLRVIKDLHSHLEPLHLVTKDNLLEHITLSYSTDLGGTGPNVVNVPGFPLVEDPTRFYSVHCHLYSFLRRCQSMSR